MQEFNAAIVRPLWRSENRTSDVFWEDSLQLWIEIDEFPRIKPDLRLLTRSHPRDQIVAAIDADLLIDIMQVSFDRCQRDE